MNAARLRRTVRVWRLTVRNAVRFILHRLRRLAARREQRERLDQRFAINTAADVARELGNMKGAVMKAGQLVSFIVEALPPEAQDALATLQSDAPPMAPALAAGVVQRELGAQPERIFLDWQPIPAAAASIGQVHRAVLHDGRRVAVKVQYPGVDDAIEADLANVDVLYSLFSAFAAKGLDTKALVNELRERLHDELDYSLEAASQREFADHFHEHPFVTIPAIVGELSTRRVLTSEWAEGWSWSEFVAGADHDAKQRTGEVIWRFAQHAVHRLGAFNGDPHPGNYRFTRHGDVTFIDFGLVKRWSAGEWERLAPSLDAIVVHRDPERLVDAMVSAGFLAEGHGLDPADVYDYVSSPYRPYLTDTFTFTRDFVRDTLGRIIDVKGPHADVIARLNMPTSFVILDRVVWGVSAILGKLEVSGPWRGMLLEYRIGADPATPLGEEERRWRSGPTGGAR